MLLMRTNDGGQDREIEPARCFVGFLPLEPGLGACTWRRIQLQILALFCEKFGVFVELTKLRTFRGCENREFA